MLARNQKEGHVNSFPSFANGIVPQRIHAYIPVDYIKAEITGISRDFFLNNCPILKFTPILKNGCEIHSYWAKHQNVKIEIFENGGIYLSGSLHKFYNQGIYNYNDFDRNAFQVVLNRFKAELGIDPANLRLMCLEYAVNIKPPIPTKSILSHSMQHKRKDREQKISKDKGDFLQFGHTTYILKLYDKALQNNLKDDLLRIEIKQKNWSWCRLNLGIHTLQDWIDADKTIFIHTLIQRWDEVVFYDPTNELPHPFSKFNEYNNEIFWSDLRDSCKSNTTFSKHSKRLNFLNETYGSNVQNAISKLIYEKIESLQGFTNSNFSEIDQEHEQIKRNDCIKYERCTFPFYTTQTDEPINSIVAKLEPIDSS